MRNGLRRLLSSIFVGICIGLVLSIGSLHLSKVQRDAVAAIGIAQTQAANAETALAEQLGKAARLPSLQKQLIDARAQLKAAEAREASIKKEWQAADKLISDLDVRHATAASETGFVPDRHTPWRPSEERDRLDPSLAAFLRKVAINDEVFAALSNINLAAPGGMLDTWMEGVKRSGVKNAMVIALDSETRQNAEARGIPSHQMHVKIPKAQANNGNNHAVSAMKFRILRSFLRLGYSVFLSDVDICVFDDPFKYLVRDSDIEGMSDGFDNATAYGYNDVLDDASMGWARYAHSMRVFVFNSGLFYIRPTAAAMELLDRVVEIVENTGGWDQAVFNEVIFFPSRPNYTDVNVKRRVLDYLQFMNSKVLFKKVRHDASLANFTPVTIHVNYHPNKHERMLAIIDRYVHGNMHALDRFPGGSEPGS